MVTITDESINNIDPIHIIYITFHIIKFLQLKAYILMKCISKKVCSFEVGRLS